MIPLNNSILFKRFCADHPPSSAAAKVLAGPFSPSLLPVPGILTLVMVDKSVASLAAHELAASIAKCKFKALDR